jgi:signal transduction histidine kinase
MIVPRDKPITKNRNLMDESHRMSILISSCTILLIQLISIAVLSAFMIADTNHKAIKTADEIRVVLTEPLYNVDDQQTIRIGEALLSSERVAGITIVSAESGRLLDKSLSAASRWIPSQKRDIEYEGIHLGTVELHFSYSGIAEVTNSFLLIMLTVIAAVLVANYLAHRLFSRKRIKRILDQLMGGIREIAAGRYDRRIDETGYDDIDAIIRLMNDMSSKVKSKNEELLVLNSGLERRVADRTFELEAALSEQRLLQDQLIEAGKLTALGQLSAGIAHELNTPLGAIQSSNQTLIEFFDVKASAALEFFGSLEPAERSLHETILSLGIKENRTLNVKHPGRKLARETCRRLEDAHVPESEEIADQLTEIGLSDRVSDIVPLLVTSRNLEIIETAGEAAIARRMVEIIDEASRRAAGVVSAFRSYLSPETSEEGTIVDIAADIGRVLTLMHNMLKRGIILKTDLAPAVVRGSSDKLSQVWMNLIRNAAQAMEYSGTLEISTIARGETAVASVTDSGPGIPDDIRDRIFEPFFTTKRRGEGIGLGLDICKKIVESHHGTITFESRPGRTEFIVSLPAITHDTGNSNSDRMPIETEA